MSDELYDEVDGDAEYEEIEEEISSEEVDRVLETLSNLMENVESEAIHEYLEESYNHIFSLIYEEDSAEMDDDEEDDDDEDFDIDDEIEDDDLEDLDDEAEAA
jgi:hypothetical protein